jgi:hypothetical protein
LFPQTLHVVLLLYKRAHLFFLGLFLWCSYVVLFHGLFNGFFALLLLCLPFTFGASIDVPFMLLLFLCLLFVFLSVVVVSFYALHCHFHP